MEVKYAKYSNSKAFGGGGQPNLSEIPAKELLTSQPKDECG